MAKVGEIETNLPRRISLPKTSGRARRMRHQRNTQASYATDSAESLNALNGVSLLPLCKLRKRSMSRKEGLPHSNYSMSFKLRWKVNLVDACTWKPSSILDHYKLC